MNSDCCSCRAGDLLLFEHAGEWTFGIVDRVHFPLHGWIECAVGDMRPIVSPKNGWALLKSQVSPAAGKLIGNRYPTPQAAAEAVWPYRL